jgi:hypothetical protein
MSSFNEFLEERRISDIYDSLTAEQKLEWNNFIKKRRRESNSSIG